MRISQKKYSIVRKEVLDAYNQYQEEVDFKDFQEGTVSDLAHCLVYKYRGTQLGGNAAKVIFFYANANVREIFGPEQDIFILAKRVINDKKNYQDKEKMMQSF